jgi:hypothetical protein
VGSEWTTLAAIVHHCYLTNDLSVASLATGTKCVTGARFTTDSSIISDCHAESLLKRAFKRYLLSKIAAALTTNTLHPQVHGDQERETDEAAAHHVLDDKDEYYMFVSQLPCGTVERYEGASPNQSLHQIHRKPGRGEPCLKASCTDKLAKWLIMGLQGRKLMRLLHNPIKLKGIVIGNCVRDPEFDQDLFATRICASFPSDDPSIANMSSHLFHPVTDMSILFDDSFRKECLTRDPGKRASPSAIVCWMDGRERKVEVIVAGRKQGLNCKTQSSNKLLIATDVINSDIDALVSKGTNNSAKTSEQMQKYGETWETLLLTERFAGYDREKDGVAKRTDAGVR